jgi:heme-degrading monooxygenase HmoA
MATQSIAKTPEPPYFAVIFTSQRTEGERGYGSMADRMVELAAQQPGFLGVESVRGNDGFGITVSYWRSLEDISAWRNHSEHLVAQEAGKRVWYSDYHLRICEVKRTRSAPAPTSA